LPKVAKGKSLVGILSTEPQGGSDVAGFKTKITREGGKLMVNGQKSYISLIREISRRGGGYFTLGTSEPSLGARGMTAFYMPLDRPGVSTNLVEDMGRMALSTGNIDMKKVEIPEHYVVGEWNKGFYVGMEGFQAARVLVSAACIGCWEGVLEMGMNYIKERETFGHPLATNEGIQFPLVRRRNGTSGREIVLSGSRRWAEYHEDDNWKRDPRRRVRVKPLTALIK